MPTWSSPIVTLEHGDAVDATFLNNIAADLQEIYDWMVQYDSALEIPTLMNYDQMSHWVDRPDSDWCAVRQHRFLYYWSSGDIEDIQGNLSTVSLPNTTDAINVKDLDEIGWLSYGKMFRITGVTWCFMGDD